MGTDRSLYNFIDYVCVVFGSDAGTNAMAQGSGSQFTISTDAQRFDVCVCVCVCVQDIQTTFGIATLTLTS